MAFVQCGFYSQVLGMESSVNIILPLGRKSTPYSEKKADIPVLYLLHGYTEDHTAWTRRTAIERYVLDMNLAVVMPNVHKSFYIDAKHGLKYFEFVSKELPALMSSMFGVSEKREDNFVAGLSMGGYGALKMALTHPDRFCMAASFSGAVDISRIFNDENSRTEVQAVFGDKIDECNDLYSLAKNTDKLPYIYQSCGSEDFLHSDNVKFAQFMKEINPDFTYYEQPGASHTWDFWDSEIRNTLKLIKGMNDRI